MKRQIICALLVCLMLLPAAQADLLFPGQKPPRNEQSEAFVELYKDGITSWDPAYNTAFEGVDELVLWRYPNSGEVTDTVSTEWLGGEKSLADYFTPCYRDEEGRFWGYINYIYGRRMAWVCLSDPSNADLPADPEVVAAVEKAVGPPVGLAVGLVAAVAAGTGVLLYVFWYRKKRKAEA